MSIGNKKIPVKKFRVTRTRNGGTMTESEFFTMLRTALRTLSVRWKPIHDCRKRARRKYDGPDKKQKWEYQCSKCGGWYKYESVNVDHIDPCGQLRSFDDLSGFAERLFVEVDKLAVLCNNCHAVKTKDEKIAMKYGPKE